MYKYKKVTAIIVALVMLFTLVLSPALDVYAGGVTKEIPTIKTPTVNEPTIELPAKNPPASIKNPGTIKDPGTIKNRPDLGIAKVEPAAKVKGVTSKVKANVEVLPTDKDYSLEEISLEELASYESGIKAPGGTQNQAPDLKKAKGLKHVPGSKFLVLPKKNNSGFALEKGKIYMDEEQGLAYRVLEDGKVDESGNEQYVVDNANLTEIFDSYKIPAQDIKLTTGNIAYMAPGVELDPKSGLQKNLYAGYVSSIKNEGNKHIINLKADNIIFQYPSAEDEKKSKEEKEKADKEKFAGDWWDKEAGKALKGPKDDQGLKVKLAIKKGTIIVEDPTFHADFDLNWLTTHVGADFYFESKTIADVTFVGDISINKGMEACIFGYDIDLGSVMGEAKGNRAYVGIFLVVGANGKLHVDIKVTSTGSARAGYEYKAFAYGFLPYSVGPYFRFRPTGFDAAFTATGEMHLVMACVPQVGVIIWGYDIAALQIWVGYKADIELAASGGGGTTTDTNAMIKGSASVEGFADLIGILFNKKYEIFHLSLPLYKGEWVYGEEVAGEGGDAVKDASPSFFVKADASTNMVEGKIAYGEKSKPFANKKYAVEIWNSKDLINQKLKATLNGTTDGEGNFKMATGSCNLLPSDTVIINIEQPLLAMFSQFNNIATESKRYFVDGDSKYRLTAVKSNRIFPMVPFADLDFDVDAFNDIITGTVSGKYTGPVDLIVSDWQDVKTKYVANAVDGVFSLHVPIDKNTFHVMGEINFEGKTFPQNIIYRKPNLDALDINVYNEFLETQNDPQIGLVDKGIDKTNINRNTKRPTNALPKDTKKDVDDEGNKIIRPTKIIGTITNRGEIGETKTAGEDYVRNSENNGVTVQPFTGDVKITSVPIVQGLLKAVNERDGSSFADPIANSREITVLTTKAKSVTVDGKIVAGSTFEFVNPELLAYTLEIKHDGLTKTIEYNPFKFHYDTTLQDMVKNINQYANRPKENGKTIITEEKKDAIVNPGSLNIGNILNQGNSMMQSNISMSPSATKQWNEKWTTSIGTMELTQDGNAVEGYIMQGSTAYAVEGKIVDGVFKGSILIPSADSLFGDIVTIEMNISTDGKSINFKDISGTSSLKSLNGTKAIKQ